MSTLIRGDQLTPELQRYVLAAYVHRWTVENARQTYGGRCPACVQQEQHAEGDDRYWLTLPSGDRIAWHAHHLPLTTDEEWLRAHAFWITKKGKPHDRWKYAEPAWMIDTEGGTRRHA